MGRYHSRSPYIGQNSGLRADILLYIGQNSGLRADTLLYIGQNSGLRADILLYIGQNSGLRVDILLPFLRLSRFFKCELCFLLFKTTLY